MWAWSRHSRMMLAPELTRPVYQQHHTDMLELVHINPLLYLSNYASSASVPGLGLGCVCSSCRSLQGSMNKTYHALANTWCYPEPAEAIMRKKKILSFANSKWIENVDIYCWIITISTNKGQFCYASVSKLDFFVIRDWFSEAVLVSCYPFVLILYSFVVVLSSVMKGTPQEVECRILISFLL